SISTQEVQGTMKRFYDLEKEIACNIIEDLGHDCDKMPGAFGKIHTKSLVALTSFSVGLDYLDQEKYDEAREAFQKALDEDPKFDLAEQALMATPASAMLLMTTSETISGLSASGISTAAAGSAVVGGVGIGTTLAVVAVIAGGAAAAAGGGGGSSGGGSGVGTVPPQEWTSWIVPSDPAPYQDVTVWVDVKSAGVTVVYEVSGTDGYKASGSLVSDSSGKISFNIPGAEAGVTDTVTVKVPEWGPSYVQTFIYVF
ncbi:MAG: tetratricopeptide repeat protein, partial [Thermodesulfobacteriota bacterium]|nr:tetratricopeptide repeat protein [Thermodesulfobacteriota bacterium]